MLRFSTFGKSWFHFGGIVCPQAECICPGVAIGFGGEAITAGLEDRVDLVMCGKETLCLSGRLEPTHDFLSSPRRPMTSFDPVVEMGWLPSSPNGIAMCEGCGVQRQETERTA